MRSDRAALTDSPDLEARLAPDLPLDDVEAIEAWAASGAMSLTGDAGGPALAPPRGLVDAVDRLGRSIAALSHHASLTTGWGRAVAIDPLALLGERAAIAGLHRNGPISCGGATRLLPCADGRWIAVSLARPSDHDSIPAWLGIEPRDAARESDATDKADSIREADSIWEALAAEIARRDAEDVMTRGLLLALPVAILGERAPTDRPAVMARRSAAPRVGRGSSTPLVVDLSSLWAGPLCGHLLQLAGAEVIKVESITRPDGARSGPAAFFDLLNGGKTMTAVDFADPRDVAALARMLRAADVVIEASRPRALAQFGLSSAALAPDGDRVWVTITGHGAAGVDEATTNRVGFGDDAAVAGGCVAFGENGPMFCADAIADPLAGLAAAATALAALAGGGSWSLDVALSAVAAWASRGGPPSTQDIDAVPSDRSSPVAAAPRARQPQLTAGHIGADNAWLDRIAHTNGRRR